MSKLFTASQIRAWDAFTIEHEPIESADLMERAAKACVSWMIQKWPDTDTGFAIFCGNGNNGGDGIAIARLLLESAYRVRVYLSEDAQRSPDNQAMLNELKFLYDPCIVYINECPVIHPDCILIDALFGTGLNRKPDGLQEELISFFNDCYNTKVSIDIPSGLPADSQQPFGEVIRADYTITFQQYKPSFLFPETGKFCGEVKVLDIGLHSEFESKESSVSFIIDMDMVRSIYKKRNAFSHKGNFGHALLIAGSHGKMGAAVIAAKACLRAGAGLLSVLVPDEENQIIQIALPEAMTLNYSKISQTFSFDEFTSVGIGSGIGTDEIALNILTQLLQQRKSPIILDADALNLLSLHSDLLALVPPGSVLTPHPKEFDRLFGESSDSFERNKRQIVMSKKLKVYIVLKGRYTSISTPDGECFYNTTGNAGMGKGGSGDALTGIITAMFAQYKSMQCAVLLGVYLHGLAGNTAAIKYSKESMLVSDLIDCLGDAFLTLQV